jgi:signal transduction histidine kinase
MSNYFQSLWFRLLLGLTACSILAVIVGTAFLYIRFRDISGTIRENTLQGQARLIASLVKTQGLKFELPSWVAPYYQTKTGEFAILAADETILAASSGVIHPFHPLDPDLSKEFFSYPQRGGELPYHGITLRIKGISPPRYVQIAFKDDEVFFDSILEEFLQDIGWIWLPFVFVLLGINLIIMRFSLRPLSQVAKQASSIGPTSVSHRLSESGMPNELLTFIREINGALDRLEQGYQEQQAFISDAAHELKTPVTIMNTHMNLLPNFAGKAALKDELGSLKRLINQLLDNARIEALKFGPNDKVDLNALVIDVATYLAPWAISLKRNIEVTNSGEPAIVCGSYEFLFRALRNLIENGIQHTPVGTVVSVVVRAPGSIFVADRGPGIPVSERKAIFGRFWQGRRDRGEGAGLGMAIISRTLKAHDAKIEVNDRPGGGAVFRVTFPRLSRRRQAYYGEPTSGIPQSNFSESGSAS